MNREEMDQEIQEAFEFLEIAGMFLGMIWVIVKAIPQLVILAVRDLMNPQDVRAWRTVWIYFVFPVVFVGGFGVLVSAALAWLLPSPFDWIVIGVWLFYLWFCEPVMYYGMGNGFERSEYWIETGQSIPFYMNE